MTARPITRGSSHSKHIERYWFENRILPDGIADKLLRKVLEIVLSPARRSFPGQAYLGSQWWALTRDSVQYVLRYADTHTEFFNFIHNCFAPDEYFFHTIIYNSPCAASCPPLLPVESEITPYDMGDLHCVRNGAALGSHFEALQSSGKLFVRKVASGVSDELLDLLDNLPQPAER
jgi:hypothetical protein